MNQPNAGFHQSQRTFAEIAVSMNGELLKIKDQTGYGLNSEHSGRRRAIRLQPPGSAPGQRQNGAVLIGSPPA